MLQADTEFFYFFGFGCERPLAALFGPFQKNSSVGVLESALPRGNSTTTHSLLMPPTHMCAFCV